MARTGPDDGLVAELFVQAERTAARIVGSGMAEDVASETVIRALTRWSKVSDYPHAWVTTVATNLAIDILRRHDRVVTGGTVADARSSFETDTVERMDVAAGLRGLSRRQQQVVVLHYLAGFSDGQVSEVLGLSVPTVKTHLGRAMVRLRRLESDKLEESDASADPA